MDIRLIKKLLKKTRLIKFVWNSLHSPLWCVDYIEDSTDEKRELNYILFRYNLKYGIYLYSSNRHNFKLIAIINEKGVKVL